MAGAFRFIGSSRSRQNRKRDPFVSLSESGGPLLGRHGFRL